MLKVAILLLVVFGIAVSTGLPSHPVSDAVVFPVAGARRGRMTLGTTVNTGECAHIGRNCILQRDRVDDPTVFTYVPCCKFLTCQGIGPAEIRNGLGQALKSDDNTFTGMCTIKLDDGGGDVNEYKEYVAGL